MSRDPKPDEPPITIVPTSRFRLSNLQWAKTWSFWLSVLVAVVIGLILWLSGWLELITILWYRWITDGAFYSTQPVALGALCLFVLLWQVFFNRDLYANLVRRRYAEAVATQHMYERSRVVGRPVRSWVDGRPTWRRMPWSSSGPPHTV